MAQVTREAHHGTAKSNQCRGFDEQHPAEETEPVPRLGDVEERARAVGDRQQQVIDAQRALEPHVADHHPHAREHEERQPQLARDVDATHVRDEQQPAEEGRKTQDRSRVLRVPSQDRTSPHTRATRPFVSGRVRGTSVGATRAPDDGCAKRPSGIGCQRAGHGVALRAGALANPIRCQRRSAASAHDAQRDPHHPCERETSSNASDLKSRAPQEAVE
ncbi:MAG: hypothetical protein U0610_32485 [bacterium]